MITKNDFNPNYAIHPGETLKEKLEEITMSSKELAIRTSKPTKTISEVINGKSSITPEMAVQFEQVLKIRASFWIQSQANYNEIIAKQKQEKDIKESEKWANKFPYVEMTQLGWIKSARKINEKTKELLGYFNISKSSSWYKIYIQSKLRINFRISLKYEKDPFALSAWLFQGEKSAQKMLAPSYNKNILKEKLSILKQIMVNNPNNLYSKIQSTCRDAGVKIVFTTLLPKTVISGVARWIKNNPVIQISDRYKRYDIFWFTLFHEIGHIILHSNKKNIFIDDINNINNINKENKQEKEANNFAVKCLLNDEEYYEIVEELKSGKNIIDIIKLFANKFDTHPDIIIGRLLRDNKKLYQVSTLRKMITKIDFKEYNLNNNCQEQTKFLKK